MKKETKKKQVEEIKINIIFIIFLMTLLFTICFVLYSDVFKKDKDININTNFNFNGENSLLALELEQIIPYTPVTNQKYLTAYQDKDTTAINIHNDVLLMKGYEYLNRQKFFTSDNLLNVITKLYGKDIFIIQNSFSLNGHDLCSYNSEKHDYSCTEENINNIIYQAKRKVNNINIHNDEVYLEEYNLFYSVEKINNITYYKIYQNGTYQKAVDSFTNEDLEKANTNLDNYLNNYQKNMVKYVSKFMKNENSYIWIGTEYE